MRTVWRRNRRHRRGLFTVRIILLYYIIYIYSNSKTSISIISVPRERLEITKAAEWTRIIYIYIYNGNYLYLGGPVVVIAEYTHLYIYIYTHNTIVNRYDLTLSMSGRISSESNKVHDIKTSLNAHHRGYQKIILNCVTYYYVE